MTTVARSGRPVAHPSRGSSVSRAPSSGLAGPPRGRRARRRGRRRARAAGASSCQPSRRRSSRSAVVGSQSSGSPSASSQRSSPMGCSDRPASPRASTCRGPSTWNGKTSGTRWSARRPDHPVRRRALLVGPGHVRQPGAEVAEGLLEVEAGVGDPIVAAERRADATAWSRATSASRSNRASRPASSQRGPPAATATWGAMPKLIDGGAHPGGDVAGDDVAPGPGPGAAVQDAGGLLGHHLGLDAEDPQAHQRSRGPGRRTPTRRPGRSSGRAAGRRCPAGWGRAAAPRPGGTRRGRRARRPRRARPHPARSRRRPRARRRCRRCAAG